MTVWADWATIEAGTSWVTTGMDYQVHDYHLTAASPCIDGGYTQSCRLDETDLDGEPRVMDGWIEMGVDEFTGVPGFLYGDLDCDCLINSFDIDPFVQCLATGEPYPGCTCDYADCNGDGVVNGFDIDPFVALLIGC